MSTLDSHEILANQNINDAIQYYLVHGQSSFLKRLIQKQNPTLFSKRLFEAIESESNNVQPTLPVNIIQPTIEDAPITKESTISIEKRNIEHVIAQRKYHYKQMKEHRLGIFSDDFDTRKKAALATLQHQKHNKELWLESEFFQVNGYLPIHDATEGLENTSTIELIQLQKKYQKYVYKYEAEAKKGIISDNIRKKLLERKSAILTIDKILHSR